MIAGLDPARYRSSSGGSDERAFQALGSQISDVERFKECRPFLVRCRHCKGEVPFAPLHDLEVCFHVLFLGYCVD